MQRIKLVFRLFSKYIRLGFVMLDNAFLQIQMPILKLYHIKVKKNWHYIKFKPDL